MDPFPFNLLLETIIDNKYIVYEVYGKDKPSKYLQGVTQKIILGKTREYINTEYGEVDHD